MKLKGKKLLNASIMAAEKIRPAALKAGVRLETSQRFGFHNRDEASCLCRIEVMLTMCFMCGSMSILNRLLGNRPAANQVPCAQY